MPFGFINPRTLEAVVEQIDTDIEKFIVEKSLRDKPRRDRFLKNIRKIEKLRDRIFASGDEQLLTMLEAYIRTTAKQFSSFKS